MALATFLQRHASVRTVHYPGLDGHPQHPIAKRLFAAPSWLLSCELKSVDTMAPTLNRLRIPLKASGLGDTRSLIIPAAPTIHWGTGAEVRADMEVSDGMVRVSVGLEDENDLIADFEQALGA
jgi:O-acetylhomoserine (thiol)-lyase